VALDSNGKPKMVEPIITESEEEKMDFEMALQRREMRLFLAGRIKFSDAKGLQSILKD
jgi:acyl-CoA hydrolase